MKCAVDKKLHGIISCISDKLYIYERGLPDTDPLPQPQPEKLKKLLQFKGHIVTLCDAYYKEYTK